VSDFSLVIVIAVDLCGVVVLDAFADLVEQFDELCGGLVGEARKHEGRRCVVSLDLLEGGLDMLGGDLSELGQCGGGECVVGDAVDLARQALGGLEQRLDGCWLE